MSPNSYLEKEGSNEDDTRFDDLDRASRTD